MPEVNILKFVTDNIFLVAVAFVSGFTRNHTIG